MNTSIMGETNELDGNVCGLGLYVGLGRVALGRGKRVSRNATMADDYRAGVDVFQRHRSGAPVMNWYCLSSYNAIKTAKDLREAGFIAYTPVERVTRTRRRTTTEIERSLYLGYGFVLCEPGDLAAVRAAGAIHDFVRYYDANGSAWPVTITARLVVAILLAEMFGAFDHTDKTPPAYRPAKGDRVRISRGKFAGYFARIMAVSKNRTKLDVEKGGRMDIDPKMLEAA